MIGLTKEMCSKFLIMGSFALSGCGGGGGGSEAGDSGFSDYQIKTAHYSIYPGPSSDKVYISLHSTQGASGLIIDFGTSKSAKIESLPSAVYSFGRHGSLSSRLRRKLRILLRHLAPVCLYGVKI